MVRAEVDVAEAIEHFVESLKKGIRVEAIVLYGSHVTGTTKEWSDIDVAVISPDFEGVTMSKRQERISDLTFHRVGRIEPIGYPSSEYRNPGPHSFLREIVRTGRVVYPKTS